MNRTVLAEMPVTTLESETPSVIPASSVPVPSVTMIEGTPMKTETAALTAPTRAQMTSVITMAGPGAQPWTPSSTASRQPPKPTTDPIDRSNSWTASDTITPSEAMRMTVWVLRISLIVDVEANASERHEKKTTVRAQTTRTAYRSTTLIWPAVPPPRPRPRPRRTWP